MTDIPNFDCAAHLHVAAWHAEGNFRAFTPGLGVLCRRGDALAAAGVFKNSEGGTGPYVMAGYQPWVINGVRLGAYAGVINGYKRGTVPMAAGLMSIPTRKGELHLSVIPKVKGITPWTIGVSHSF